MGNSHLLLLSFLEGKSFLFVHWSELLPLDLFIAGDWCRGHRLIAIVLMLLLIAGHRHCCNLRCSHMVFPSIDLFLLGRVGRAI